MEDARVCHDVASHRCQSSNAWSKNIPPLKTRFIVNLHSGRAAHAFDEIQQFAAHHGASIVVTQRAGHAGELAAQALSERCGLIVAVGGDGTMNEVAGHLIGRDAILGLVPCGSGDGLGRHLRIHGSIARALEILHTGKPRVIDTGLADGHPFCTAAGLGFEAEIARRFNRLKRRGFARYLTTSARAFREWQPQAWTISHGLSRDRMPVFTLAVCNANQYGNEARIAPRAKLDDGLLDLCALPPLGWKNLLPVGFRLFQGTLDRARDVFQRRSSRFIVERESAGPLHTDGEVHEAAAHVEFAVRPASLTIMAPAQGRDSTGAIQSPAN